jgi:hypothetical protein
MKKTLPIVRKCLLSLCFILVSLVSAHSQSATCPAVSNLQFSNVGMHQALITWDNITGGIYEVHLANNFDGSVEYFFPEDNQLSLSGLYSNTQYDVYIYNFCEYYEYSDYVNGSFTTLPDCSPASNVQLYPAKDSVYIEWDNNTVATYFLTLKQNGSVITSETVYGSPYYFTDLTPGTEYEIVLDVWCEDYSTASSSHSFTTEPLALNYCSSSGADSKRNYVSKVMLANLVRTSSDDGGYADATSFSGTVAQGESYPLTLQAGGNGKKYISAWIDYNQDGDFEDEGEQVAWVSTKKGEPVITSVNIPSDAVMGSTRLRVSVSQQKDLEPCGTIAHGETEDYTLVIQESTSESDVALYPNPVYEQLFITSKAGADVVILNSAGKVMYKGATEKPLNVREWPEGTYYLVSDGKKTTIRFIKSNN